MDTIAKENRAITLRFRATLVEKKQIETRAQAGKLTVSDYLRTVALGASVVVSDPPRAEPLTAEQRRVLIGIATNLNQAMHVSNAKQYATEELITIISTIKAALK